jgi:hypothetical protein
VTAKAPRSLALVIDQLIAIEPALAEPLKSTRSSALFTAPEMMGPLWRECSHLLEHHVPIGHPKAPQVQAAYNGSPTLFWKGSIRVTSTAESEVREVQALGFTVLEVRGRDIDVRGPYEALVALEPKWGPWLWSLRPVLEGQAS